MCFSGSNSSGLKPGRLFAAFISSMALVSFASGCVFVPTPPYYARGSRHNVTKQTTKKIEPGLDTIEEVMLKLGEPDDISPDERRIGYRTEKIVGLVYPVGAGALPNNDPSFPVNRTLNIAFDNKGVVTNRQVSTRLGWTFPGHPLWMLTGSIALRPQSGLSVLVHRTHAGCS